MQPEIEGQFWFKLQGKPFLGSARIQLLEQVAATGSISAAARAIGMSYKAAWDAIDAMNNLSDQPLLKRQAGGRHGGGTRLTAHGEQVIAQYRAAEKAYQAFLEHMAQSTGELGDVWTLMRKLSMRTTARNHYQGKVSRITQGAVSDEVTVDIGQGLEVHAVVTHEAGQELGLEQGRAVHVLIKSSFVVLGEVTGDMRVSARNRLPGTVAHVEAGPVNAEVKLDLGHGRVLTAIVTREALDEGWVTEGAEACALIKASHVLLAVTD
ncbi:MAG: TOBE domain-containing protein [Pseudomonadota bacterium]